MCDEPNPMKPWQLSPMAYGKGIPALCLLHQEIEHFYKYIQLTPTEFCLRADAVRRIEDVLYSIWPSACVDIFGSSRTGLNLPTSDIDMVVHLGNYWSPAMLHHLERELVAREVTGPGPVTVLDKASVPVVKFTERVSRIKFDVSFNEAVSGVQAAELIKDFIHQFPELPKLIMVLKQFLRLHGLNEVYRSGGISSYALTLMCVSFMQAVTNKKYSNSNKLGLMLLQFLEYFGRKFDLWKYAISVLGEGGRVEKERLRSSLGWNNFSSMLTIEDPVTPTNDIGRSSYAALHVIQGFEAAFLNLSKLVDSAPSKILGPILDTILDVPPDVLSYRAWVHYNFKHILPSRISLSSSSSSASEGQTTQFKPCNAASGTDDERDDRHG